MGQSVGEEAVEVELGPDGQPSLGELLVGGCLL